MKLSHASVDYGPGHPDGDHCAICEHYRQPHCEIVADPIKPNGWCKRFEVDLSKAVEIRLSKKDKN